MPSKSEIVADGSPLAEPVVLSSTILVEGGHSSLAILACFGSQSVRGQTINPAHFIGPCIYIS
jgi:hypothetical protein